MPLNARGERPPPEECARGEPTRKGGCPHDGRALALGELIHAAVRRAIEVAVEEAFALISAALSDWTHLPLVLEADRYAQRPGGEQREPPVRCSVLGGATVTYVPDRSDVIQ